MRDSLIQRAAGYFEASLRVKFPPHHCTGIVYSPRWNSPLSEINTLEIFITRDCKNEIWTTRRYSDGQPFEDFLSLDIFSWSQSELWAEIKFSWSNLLQIVSINWHSSLLTHCLHFIHWKLRMHRSLTRLLLMFYQSFDYNFVKWQHIHHHSS